MNIIIQASVFLMLGLSSIALGSNAVQIIYHDGLNNFEPTNMPSWRGKTGVIEVQPRYWFLRNGAFCQTDSGHASLGCLRIPAGGSTGFKLRGLGSEDSFLSDDYEIGMWVKREGEAKLYLKAEIEGPVSFQSRWEIGADSGNDWARVCYRTGIFSGLYRGQVELTVEGKGTVLIDDFEIIGKTRSDPDWMTKEMPELLPSKWKFKADAQREGMASKYYSPDFNDNAWEELAVTNWWEALGHAGYDGWGWYRVKVSFPADPAGKAVFIKFPAVDELATVWVNGKYIMSHGGWDTPFIARIDQALEPGKAAVIVVLVEDYSGGGGIYKQPVTIIGEYKLPRLEKK